MRTQDILHTARLAVSTNNRVHAICAYYAALPFIILYVIHCTLCHTARWAHGVAHAKRRLRRPTKRTHCTTRRSCAVHLRAHGTSTTRYKKGYRSRVQYLYYYYSYNSKTRKLRSKQTGKDGLSWSRKVQDW